MVEVAFPMISTVSWLSTHVIVTTSLAPFHRRLHRLAGVD